MLGLLALAFSAVFLGWLLTTNWSLVSGHISDLAMGRVAAGISLYSVDLALAVAGWGLIMRRIAGFTNFRTNFRIYSLTNLARRIPGPVWYAVGRAMMYEPLGIRKRVVAVGVAIEYIIIVATGVLCGLAFAPLPPGEAVAVRLVLGSIVVVGLALMQPRVLRALVKRIGGFPLEFSLSYADVLSFLAAYALVWVVGGLTLYVVIISLTPLPATAIPSVIGAWSLSGAAASLAAISPSGLGIKEVTLTLLLSTLIPLPLAAVVAILMRLVLTVAESAWAIVASRL